MKKIILNLEDDVTIRADSGAYVGTLSTTEKYETYEPKDYVKEILKLKEGGFTAEEIIEFKKEGLL